MTINDVVEGYAESINGDNPNLDLARQVWSTSESASFIHPRGHEQGWDAIERNFYVRTMGELLKSRKLVPFNLNVQEYADVAVVEFYWRFDANFRQDGTPLHTEGRETQVLRRIDGDWRIQHVHYSSMPVTEVREGF